MKMNKIKLLALMGFLIVGSLASVFGADTVPKKINYQARLKDGGTPYTGQKQVKFEIWDAATSGSSLWNETHANVDFVNGLSSNVVIGAVIPLEVNDFDASSVYLEVTIADVGGGNAVTLVPREALYTVPFAFNADSLDGLDTSESKVSEKTIYVSKTDGFLPDGVVQDATIVGTISKSKVEDSANWDTAFGWGDHADGGYLLQSAFQATEAYNITSASTTEWSTSYNVVNTSSASWDAAVGWGDHAGAGYLTSYTETDPVYNASASTQVVQAKIDNWDTAFGWGDHADGGYLTPGNETDPLFAAHISSQIVSLGSAQIITSTGRAKLNGIEVNADVTDAANVDAAGAVMFADVTTATGKLVRRAAPGSFDSVDDNSANWNTAFGWGDHALGGYLTPGNETDPLFVAHVSSQIATLGSANIITTVERNKLTGIEASADVTDATNVDAAGAIMDGDISANGIMLRTGAGVYSTTTNNSANWDTAYGWGDHAVGGYFSPSTDSGVIGSYHIINGTITAAQIQARSISADRIIADSLGSGEIGGGAIGVAELASSAVTNSKIASGAVSATKLASGAVTSAKLGQDAVTAYHIADGTVTSVAILDGEIVDADISGSAAIAASKLHSDVLVLNDNISDLTNDEGYLKTGDSESITHPMLTQDIVYSTNIVNGEIVDADISGSAAIAASKLHSDVLVLNDNISDLTNDEGYLKTGDSESITHPMLTQDIVYSTNIVNGEIKSDDISDGTIQLVDISPNVISSVTVINSGGGVIGAIEDYSNLKLVQGGNISFEVNGDSITISGPTAVGALVAGPGITDSDPGDDASLYIATTSAWSGLNFSGSGNSATLEVDRGEDFLWTGDHSFVDVSSFVFTAVSPNAFNMSSKNIRGVGNIGIGVDAPTARIHVQELGVQDVLRMDTQGDDITINYQGNIGIGSASPHQKLVVVGTVTANYFSGDGSGLTNISLTETDPEVGTNVTNYVPRWNGSELVQGTVFDNGTSIGIGNASPGAKLDIASTGYGLKVSSGVLLATDNGGVGIGTANPDSKLHIYRENDALDYLILLQKLRQNSTSNQIGIKFDIDPETAARYSAIVANSEGNFGNNSYLSFVTGGGDIIGASVEQARVDRFGVRSSRLSAIDANGLELYDDGGNGLFVRDGGNVGVSTGIPSALFDVNDDFFVDNNGSVGIGTKVTSADYLLNVDGSINVTSGNLFKINGTALSAADVGAAVSGHTHTGYLQSTGDDMSGYLGLGGQPIYHIGSSSVNFQSDGDLDMSDEVIINIGTENSGFTAEGGLNLYGLLTSTKGAVIKRATGDTSTVLTIDSGNDNTIKLMDVKWNNLGTSVFTVGKDNTNGYYAEGWLFPFSETADYKLIGYNITNSRLEIPGGRIRTQDATTQMDFEFNKDNVISTFTVVNKGNPANFNKANLEVRRGNVVISAGVITQVPYASETTANTFESKVQVNNVIEADTDETINGIDINAGAVSDVTSLSIAGSTLTGKIKTDTGDYELKVSSSSTTAGHFYAVYAP
ncbi:beta strand repeat-containing protein [bacterium]